MFYFAISGFSVTGFLLVAAWFGIRDTYRRRKYSQLIEERNRLLDQDDQAWKRVQQDLSEWTGRMHPRAAKELQDWYVKRTAS